jgi:hypothetical protein
MESFILNSLCVTNVIASWSLITVYGPAQNEKEAFLTEKSKGNFERHWPFLFNAVRDGI